VARLYSGWIIDIERQEDLRDVPLSAPRRALNRQTRVLLVVVVLAAVIAVSTSAGGLGDTQRTGSANASDLLWRVAIGGAIGALVGLAGLAALHRLAPSRPPLARWLYGEVWESTVGFVRGSKVPAQPSWGGAWRRGIPLLLLLASVGALIGASTAPLHPITSTSSTARTPPPEISLARNPSKTIQPTNTRPAAPITTVPRSQANKVVIPSWIAQLFLTLLAVAVLAAIVVGIARRMQKPDEAEKPEQIVVDTSAATAVALSVDRSRTELVVENDPRRAIIAAYQTLLDGLSEVGLARRPQEAPEEYLRRSLAGVSVDLRPFQELTRLFGLARFSSHDVTEAHRADAQRALANAAASLPNLPHATGSR
jgi:Domain of unknown function (DUF4129)